MYSIYVDKGPFRTVEEAAFAEKSIDWWDGKNESAAYCTECYAAVELAKYLRRVLKEGLEVSLQDMGDALCGENIIIVGHMGSNPAIMDLYKRAVQEGLIGKGEASLKTSGESFSIWSFFMEGKNYTILSGKGRVGTLYAVYSYLEKAGIRWYSPGEQGTVYPEEKLSGLPEGNVSSSPHFYTRGCYSEFIDDREEDFLDWLAHNRINYVHLFKVKNPHGLKKRGISIAGGGHEILYRFLDPNSEYPYRHALYGGEGKTPDPYPVSPEYKGDIDGDGVLTYFEAHPEWFALVKGKRSCRRSAEALKEQYFSGDNYCLTNSQANEELAKNLIRELAVGDMKTVEYLNFWLLDNGDWCGCDSCKAKGNYTDRLLWVVHSLRRELVKAVDKGLLKRDVKIIFPAYHETLTAPERPLPEDFDYNSCIATFFPIERCYVHAIDDKGCTETNAALLESYRKWTCEENRNYRGELFIGEYYNVRTFAAMPVVLRKIISHDIPFYYGTGTRHFYYMHMTSGKWGVLTLNNYLYARLLWDTEGDSGETAREYIKLYYRETAEKMYEFYEKLEEAMKNIKYIKHYQEKDGKRYSMWREFKDSSEEELFSLEHMKYGHRTESTDSGISLVETVGLMDECRRLLEAAKLQAAEDITIKRLLEDEMRFNYGYDMIMFYYHMVRKAIFVKSGKKELAKAEVEYCRFYGEKLRKTVTPLENYNYSKYYENGLTASWLENEYEKIAEEV